MEKTVIDFYPPTGAVAETARQLGICRQTVTNTLRRRVRSHRRRRIVSTYINLSFG